MAEGLWPLLTSGVTSSSIARSSSRVIPIPPARLREPPAGQLVGRPAVVEERGVPAAAPVPAVAGVAAERRAVELGAGPGLEARAQRVAGRGALPALPARRQAPGPAQARHRALGGLPAEVLVGHLVARALGHPVPLDLARHGRGRDPEPARRLRQGVAGLDPVLDENPVFQSELSVLSLGHASSPPGARPRGSAVRRF